MTVQTVTDQARCLAAYDRGLMLGLGIGCALALLVYGYAWLDRKERAANTITLA